MKSEAILRRYEIFVSCKQTVDSGTSTRDSEIAEQLEMALEQRGIQTFRADSALQQLGRADYSRAITEALEQASILVVVGTTREHVSSEWVRFEWDTFLNEVRSRRKQGLLVSVLEGMSIDQLPIELRQWQSFDVSGDMFVRPCEFIEKALAGLRSQVAIEEGKRLAESGSRTVEKFDRLSRVMAESRVTELEIFRDNFGGRLGSDYVARLDEHIAKLRELLREP